MKNIINLPTTDSPLLFEDEDERSEDMKKFDEMIENNYNNLADQYSHIKLARIHYNVNKIAEAFGTDSQTAIANLQDGRSNSFWVEGTARNYYKIEDTGNKNSIIDGYITTNHQFFKIMNFGVKTLSKSGLDLIQSGFKGRGFKAIPTPLKYQALYSSIQLCDYHIIADSVEAPIIYLVPLASKDLIAAFSVYNLPLVLNRKLFYDVFLKIDINDLANSDRFEDYTP